MKKNPAFFSLLAINFAIYIIDTLLGGRLITQMAFTPQDLIGGVIPNMQGLVHLITNQFAHANFGHIFGNFFFVAPAAIFLERKLGSRKFLAYWLLSGIGGAMLFAIVPHLFGWSGIIGSSCAASGVFAAACMHIEEKAVRRLAVFALVVFFLQQLIPAIISCAVPMEVAYFGHVGGMLTALLIKATEEKYDVEPTPDSAV